MSHKRKTYTYRCGEKVELGVSDEQIVVRALPDILRDTALRNAEQVSSASTRINAELESFMAQSRGIVPTHHAHSEADSGADFLITDRVFVTFRDALADQDVDEFAGQPTLIEDSPGVIIPDNQLGGVERIASVSTSGLLTDIEIELDITHTYISDLIVELFAPDGTTVLLHNCVGGTANNILKTYSLTNSTVRQVLRGTETRGDWRLRVSDRAGLDQGKLNRWALRLVTG